MRASPPTCSKRHPDGPTGGCRDQPGQRPHLRDADQQHAAHRAAGQSRQPGGAQCPRPRHRDHAQGRRPCRHRGAWTIFIVGGKPGIDPAARYHRQTSDNGWLSCVDAAPSIARPGSGSRPTAPRPRRASPTALYGADTTGYGRGPDALLLPGSTGAEVCGPLVSPDDGTVFLAIQHPGEDAGSTYDKPSTRWPDLKDGMPPRPSVIAITKKGGGPIGSYLFFFFFSSPLGSWWGYLNPQSSSPCKWEVARISRRSPPSRRSRTASLA